MVEGGGGNDVENPHNKKKKEEPKSPYKPTTTPLGPTLEVIDLP